MCGIGVVIRGVELPLVATGPNGWSVSVCVESITNILRPRGPDATRTRRFEFGGAAGVLGSASGSRVSFEFIGSVLALRGKDITEQPVENQAGDVLLWNGEVFGGSVKAPSDRSDTQAMMAALSDAKGDIHRVLASVDGPFSAIYWHSASQTLWFGKDRMGRRSLLLGYDPQRRTLSLTSAVPYDTNLRSKTTTRGCWQEVAPVGLYCIGFDSAGRASECKLFPWPALCGPHAGVLPKANQMPKSQPMKRAAPIRVIDRNATRSSTSTDPRGALHAALARSVSSRVTDIRGSGRIAILFSGGIDCMVLAALADDCVPVDIPIDLINVAFCGDVDVDALVDNPSIGLQIARAVPDRATAILGHSELCSRKTGRRRRQWNLVEVNVTANALEREREAILALLAPREPTVMDFNISAILRFAARGRGVVYSGSYGHIDTPHARYTPSRSSVSSKPRTAPQSSPGRYSSYTTPARVYLSGVGADELFGGYARHRTAFSRGSWEALADELELDVGRLWSRNLARDDRCIASCGREARHPFLDEGVLRLLGSGTVPLASICDLKRPPGAGDKAILRAVAARLGLSTSQALVKRAMQFGTRIANSKVPGRRTLAPDTPLRAVVNKQFLTKTTTALECKGLLNKDKARKPG